MKNPINFSAISDIAGTVIQGVRKTVPKVLNQQQHSDCPCPPEQECPPQCILCIKHTAHSGEIIYIPFKIKNTHSTTKTYRIGHRPLINEFGDYAQEQPSLSKPSVTLSPQQIEVITMRINLSGFSVGSTYQMQIVIRENKYNQNICFTLKIADFSDAPIAEPWCEDSIYPKFLDWYTHFTCPSRKKEGSISFIKSPE
jgi:hypothetical protein